MYARLVPLTCLNILAVTRHLRAETIRLRLYFPCGQTKQQPPGLAMVDWV